MNTKKKEKKNRHTKTIIKKKITKWWKTIDKKSTKNVDENIKHNLDMQKTKKERKWTRRLPIHSNGRRLVDEENENEGMWENRKFLTREVMKGNK